jgi:hypothetical protein
MAKDKYHQQVREALEKDGWIITHDPYFLTIDKVNLPIDLGAERVIAAERAGERIVVEIKSFLRDSMVNEFHTALGQYLDYETNLAFQEPDRVIFLAVPYLAFCQMEKTRAVMNSIVRFHLKFAIFDPDKNEIVAWKTF